MHGPVKNKDSVSVRGVEKFFLSANKFKFFFVCACAVPLDNEIQIMPMLYDSETPTFYLVKPTSIGPAKGILNVCC